MKTKSLLSVILALALAALFAVVAMAGQSVDDNTVRQSDRTLFYAVAKSLDRPIGQWNASISTASAADISYNSYVYVYNATGPAFATRPTLAYAIDNVVYEVANGTIDMSTVNSWTTLVGNRTCLFLFYVDENGVFNGTQGTIVRSTTAGNATLTWPDTPDGVVVFAGLKLYAGSSSVVPGTTALTQGTNAWVYQLVGNPKDALTE